jgi:hypothetical protein
MAKGRRERLKFIQRHKTRGPIWQRSTTTAMRRSALRRTSPSEVEAFRLLIGDRARVEIVASGKGSYEL